MIASLLLLACAAPAVDVGWQQLDDGAYEYIIQIEPDQLESMRAGRDIFSDLPPALKHIRRYRITVGNGPLPHEGVPPELIGNPPLGRPDDAPPRDDGIPSSDNVAGGPVLFGPRNPPLSALPGPGDDDPQPAATGPAIVEAEIAVEETPVEPAPGAVETMPIVVEPAPQESSTLIVVEESPPAADRPQPFDAPIDSRPLVEPASNAVTVAAVPPANDTPQPTLTGKPVVDEDSPWWALTAVLVGLFISVGANLYLGWVTWGTRLRYRELIKLMDVRARTA